MSYNSELAAHYEELARRHGGVHGDPQAAAREMATAAYYLECESLASPSVENSSAFRKVARRTCRMYVTLAREGDHASWLKAAKMAEAVSPGAGSVEALAAQNYENRFHTALEGLTGTDRRRAIVALVAYEHRLLDVNVPDPRIKSIVDPEVLQHAINDASHGRVRGNNCAKVAVAVTAHALGADFARAEPLRDAPELATTPGLVRISWRAVFSRSRRESELTEMNRRSEATADFVAVVARDTVEWGYQARFKGASVDEHAQRMLDEQEQRGTDAKPVVAVLSVELPDWNGRRGHMLSAVAKYGVPVAMDGQTGEAFDMQEQDPDHLPYEILDSKMLVVPPSGSLVVDENARYSDMREAMENPHAYSDRTWEGSPPRSVRAAVTEWKRGQSSERQSSEDRVNVARTINQLGMAAMLRVGRAFGLERVKPEKFSRVSALEQRCARMSDGDSLLVMPKGRAAPFVVTRVDSMSLSSPLHSGSTLVGVPDTTATVRVMDITNVDHASLAAVAGTKALQAASVSTPALTATR